MTTATRPISPDTITAWRPDLPACVSNGLIGLGVRHCPLRPGAAVVFCFEGLDPTDLVETSPVCPSRWRAWHTGRTTIV